MIQSKRANSHADTLFPDDARLVARQEDRSNHWRGSVVWRKTNYSRLPARIWRRYLARLRLKGDEKQPRAVRLSVIAEF